MSKRRVGHASISAPLLAALDTEYVMAARQRNTNRMQEVLDIIHRLQPNYTPPGVSTLIQQAPPSPPPQPIPEPAPSVAPPQAPPGPVQKTYSLQDVLRAANEGEEDIVIPPMPPPAQPILSPPLTPLPVDGPLSEASRKRAARASVQNAVNDVNYVTASQHLNYQRAMMVLNGRLESAEEMKVAAGLLGIPVREHARQMVAEYDARLRRAAHVDALKVQAHQAIDNASGDDIETIASKTVREILGDDYDRDDGLLVPRTYPPAGPPKSET